MHVRWMLWLRDGPMAQACWLGVLLRRLDDMQEGAVLCGLPLEPVLLLRNTRQQARGHGVLQPML